MKFLIPILFLTYSLSAIADFQGKTIRYSTTYDSFDRVIVKQYGYSESFSSESFCGHYNTCYHPSMRTERVYIEERLVDSAYVDSYKAETRITIYSDKNYSRPYVTYHTHNGRVVNRSFHHDHDYYGWHHGCNHYDDFYFSDYYHYHNHYYYEVDWSTPEGKIITGAQFMATGIELMALCSDVDSDDARALCMGIGLAFAVSGSASSAAGVDQAIQESKLYKALENDAKINGEKDLDIQ